MQAAMMKRLESVNSALMKANLVLLSLATSSVLVLGMILLYQRRLKSIPSPPRALVKAAPVPAPTTKPTRYLAPVDDKHCPVLLIRKEHVSRDTIRFEFKYVNHARALPVGKHLKVFAPNPAASQDTWNGKPNTEREVYIERKYTPCLVTNEGFVLVVKIYSANSAPAFPDGGKMTQYLEALQVGSELECALPYGLIEYAKRGLFKKSKTLVETQNVGMVAGGSGLTPMLRLLEESLHDAEETIVFHLLFANRDEDDIILKSRLDELHANFPHRFKLQYILSRPTPSWPGLRGYITKDILRDALPDAVETTLVLVCGPPVMINGCVKENLTALGFAHKQVWDF